MRNIGQDCTITIWDGGVFSTSGPSWQSLGEVAYAKSIDIDEDDDTVDQHGMGDKRKKYRPTVGSDTLNIELMVQGERIRTTRAGYGRVEFRPSDAADLQTYSGVWTKRATKSSADDNQMQTLTLLCDYDDA